MHSQAKPRSRGFRVLVADDHAIVREGVEAMLRADGRFEVVASAENGREALHLAAECQPDVIVMDLSMPGSNGTEAIEAIKRRHPDLRIVVLTMHNAEAHVCAALRAGADGYVLKDDRGAELLAAVYNVAIGKSYLSPSISHKLVANYRDGGREAPRPSAWELLTHREREVIQLVAEGARNRDIAAQLSLSEKTIEKHRASLMRKLDLHSAAQLTAYAIRNGLTAGAKHAEPP